MVLPKITKIEPIYNAVTYFTDAKKNLKTGYSGPTEKTWQSKYSSVQKAELKTIYTVLLDIKKPVNIVLDSQYAVKITSLIETVTIPNSNLPIIQLLISYKMLFFIKIVLFILLIFDHFHNFQDL